jgi:hypothetical protein
MIKTKKLTAFKYLVNNQKISFFYKRRQFFRKYYCFKIIKIFSDIKIAGKFKKMQVNNKIENFRNLAILKKFKKFISIWSDSRNKNKFKVKIFRYTLLKIKIFKFLDKNKRNSHEKDNKKVIKFRNTFLKYNFFVLLFKFRLIKYRENKIIDGLSRIYKNKKRTLVEKVIKNWKLFYICEKFKRAKLVRKIAKIFYAMKIMLK